MNKCNNGEIECPGCKDSEREKDKLQCAGCNGTGIRTCGKCGGNGCDIKKLTKKEERQFIHDKYGGKCAYCGDPLEKGWHKDHIEAIERKHQWDRKTRKWKVVGMSKPELDIIDNMNPSCPSCNINKHSMTIEQFRKQIKGFVKSLNLRSTQYKIAKRYGLVEETEIDVTFYFERYKL